MTLTTLLTLVGDYLDDPNFGYFSQVVLITRLNQAQKELHKILADANEDFYTKSVKTNLVAGQQNYALPSDFSKVQLLELVTQGSGVTADTQPIMPIPRVEKYAFGAQSGTPQAYYLNENYLIFLPTPDSPQELRLDYTRTAVEMASGSDSPDAPERYHEYLAICVAYDGIIKDGRSNPYLLEKKKMYEDMIRMDAEQRTQDYPRTVVRSYMGAYNE